MRNIWNATKFCHLSEEKQHKELAKLLRKVYMELCKEPLPTDSFPEIADAYHYHLKKAGLSLKEHNLLPAITTQDRPCRLRTLPICILLDNIRSAYNVGNILRTFEAFGFDTVYFKGMTPLPNHKQVKDAAMGCADWIQWSQDLSALPRPLIALETSSEAIPIYDFSFPERFTLALGNEEYGLSKEILSQADALVEIPLNGRKNSLNVASAFSAAALSIERISKLI